MASLTSTLSKLLVARNGAIVGRVRRSSAETQIVTVGGRDIQVPGSTDLAVNQTVVLIKTPTGYSVQASNLAALTERRVQING